MIGYIEFENERKIGNVKLDFLKNDNEAYNTIIIAGENGCGKTAILESITGFLRGSYLSDYSSVKRVDYFEPNGEKKIILRDEEANRYTKPEGISEDDWESIDLFTEQNFYRERNELREEAPNDIRNTTAIYSEARSGFELDFKEDSNIYEEEKYEKVGANYSGLVQLLIDLEEEDNKKYLCYAKSNPRCTYEEYMSKNSSVQRFKRAFEEMFEDITYIGRDLNYDNNTIYFKKGNKQIDIDELSTGEKQIVFRGIDLLHHAVQNAMVLIDEPELSLHPKWQKKILNFYRNLFTDDKGNQIAQIIIATHSEYIIQSAMQDRENIKVIILKRENSVIKTNILEEAILGNYSIAEVNYLAFGIEMVDYHIQLFSKLHNLLQEKDESGVINTIASIDQYIKNHRCYDSTIHEKVDFSYNHYYTLPVYIRNAIDHPNDSHIYSEDDLEKSICLLREIYRIEINSEY